MLKKFRLAIFAICVVVGGGVLADDDAGTTWVFEEQAGAAQLDAAKAFLSDTAEDSTDDVFETFVGTILENRCVKCHGATEQEGELRLDTLAAALYGGETGEAVVPGDVEESLLVQAIRHLEKPKMPPKKKLPQLEIDILTRWIKRGAPWPESVTLKTPSRVREVPKAMLAIDPGATVSFNREIRPILSDHCYACHGPDGKTRKAGLRLDLEQSAFMALPSGNRAVVRGDLQSSQLFNRVAAASADDRMPPADFHKQLSGEQIELLGRWILQGASWEQHWAFIPPERPVLADTANDGWSRNAIDEIVKERLAKEGLTPNEEADRRTLIRRATLDLTGLPPTPAEIAEFLDDDRSDAYERLVDRLLSSPKYAEHQARYWLDAARYADTNGYHIDNERYMWRWRDWVIDAYDSNKPFDEFTVEQLAGDLLPEPTTEQLIATGFNRNHMVNFEGGAIPEEYRMQYVVDRVTTTGTVWMAMTMSCAQCHDHKYDPITQKEFYSLASFFNSIDEIGLDGATTGNAQPFMSVPDEMQARNLARAETDLTELLELLERPYPKLDRNQKKWERKWSDVLAKRWRVATPVGVSAHQGTVLTALDDDSVLASGEVPEKDRYEVFLKSPAKTVNGIRLELLTDESVADNKKVGRGENGNVVLTDFVVEVVDAGTRKPLRKVAMKTAMVDVQQDGTEGDKAIDDNPESGWSANGQDIDGGRAAVFLPSEPVKIGSGELLRVQLAQESKYEGRVAGRFRISVSDDPMLAHLPEFDWNIAGPFTAADARDALGKRFPPETRVRLRDTYNGGALAWRDAPENLDAGEEVELPGGKGANYVYGTVVAPSARSASLTLGVSDAVKVWLNGRQIFASDDRKMLRRDGLTIGLELKEGENKFLIKAVSFGDKARFFLKMDEETPGGAPYDVILALEKDKKRKKSDREKIREYYRAEYMPEWEDLRGEETRLQERIAEVKKEIPSTMVMRDKDMPRETFVLERGVYDKPTDQVSSITPAILPPMDDAYPNNRLGLAKWLVSDDHPLTARVTVNRIWQRYFGHGLVKTAEDFGSQGEWPTHPELLDWLAVEFRESGWDVKALHRSIVTSATYRQSSKTTPEKHAVDPENRLFARGARFRLDAEAIRDSALAVSGLLVETRGGPSVKPYQPPGLWKEVAYGANFTAQEFEADAGEALYRRSMYTFWKRTSPPPSMMVFDAPNRETCSVRRSRSNTPLQALTLMNDPQFVEASRFLAERMLREGGETAGNQIGYAFELVTGRPVSERERGILMEIYDAELAGFEREESRALELLAVGDAPVQGDWAPARLAATSVVANMILNLDEAITRN